jgi:hypothetical protein
MFIGGSVEVADLRCEEAFGRKSGEDTVALRLEQAILPAAQEWTT